MERWVRSLRDYRAELALLLALVLSSAASIFLVALRAAYTHRVAYRFLIWNLILAWIPLACAAVLRELHRRRRRIWPLLMGVGFVWLLFLPNSPYIVTDMLHLASKDSVPMWYDVILIFAFAWNGLLLGFVSVYFVQQIITERVGAVSGWLMVVGVLALSSFGIYVGRFLRWNSWDVFSNPQGLMSELGHEIAHPFDHARMVAVTGLLSMFLLMDYLILMSLMHVHRVQRRSTAEEMEPRIND